MESLTVIRSRVVAIGDSNVGKTSILNRLANDYFDPNVLQSVSPNYQSYIQQFQDVKIELQIWDTAGQERFRSLGPIYYRNADAAIAVYDHTRKASFEKLETCIKDFTDVAGINTVILVIANKSDLTESEVSYQEAAAWAKANNYIIGEASAKTGEGIKELFSKLATSILEYRMSNAYIIHDKSKKIDESDQQQSCC